MTDRRTKTVMQEYQGPTLLEHFQVPMGDIQFVPMDQHAPFHAHAYTATSPVFIGSYATVEEARERILEYASTILSYLFTSLGHKDLLQSFTNP